MKKTYVYNELEIPVEYIEIPGVGNGIHYKREEFRYKALDTLWLETSRKNSYDVIIDMNCDDCEITKLLYQFDNCNYFLVYNNLEEIKDKEYITVNSISKDNCVKMLKENFPALKNVEEEATLICSRKKKFNDMKRRKTGYTLGF